MHGKDIDDEPGNFQLGSRSANLERFWKVDYAIGSQRMEVRDTI